MSELTGLYEKFQAVEKSDMISVSDIDVDKRTGTLYAKLPGTRMVVSDRAPNDDDIVLNLNDEAMVVGVMILDALDADSDKWFNHPDRKLIPAMLLEPIDRWFRQRA